MAQSQSRHLAIALLIAVGSVQSLTESGLHLQLYNATNAVPYPAVAFIY